jgi:hypothetical protein
MAATTKWYGLSLEKSFTSTATDRINWTTDTIKVALVTNSYTPNQDTDNYANLAGFTTNELSGGGYSRQTLGTVTLTYDGASNTVRFKAADAVFGAAFTGTFRYAVVFKDTGAAATSPLIAYVDFGADQTISAGTFTINWDTTDGVVRIVAS